MHLPAITVRLGDCASRWMQHQTSMSEIADVILARVGRPETEHRSTSPRDCASVSVSLFELFFELLLPCFVLRDGS